MILGLYIVASSKNDVNCSVTSFCHVDNRKQELHWAMALYQTFQLLTLTIVSGVYMLFRDIDRSDVYICSPFLRADIKVRASSRYYRLKKKAKKTYL